MVAQALRSHGAVPGTSSSWRETIVYSISGHYSHTRRRMTPPRQQRLRGGYIDPRPMRLRFFILAISLAPRRNLRRAVAGHAGGGFELARFQTMGTSRDPGWRAAQTDRYFRARNADQDHRALELHRHARQDVAGERFHPLDAARNARLEERADGSGVARAIDREARARQDAAAVFFRAIDGAAGIESARG